MKHKATKAINAKTRELLVEVLQDVIDQFGWYGIENEFAGEGTQSESGGQRGDDQAQLGEELDGAIDSDAESETEDSELDSLIDRYVDPDDIQIAIDEAITRLIKEEVLPKIRSPKKAPSLTAVFVDLFGDDHDFIQRIEYFEDLISPYIDQVPISDLREAHDILVGVVSDLSKLKGRRRKRE